MNVTQWLDPAARHVFLIHQGLTHAFIIAHAEESFLLFRSSHPLNIRPEAGYFLARDGAGIVQFYQPLFQSTSEDLFKRAGEYFHRIDFSKLDFEITNRRHHLRHTLPQRLPVSISLDDRTITGELINISEGGMRLAASEPVSHHTRCHFEFKIEPKLPQFRLDGMVVYSGLEDSDAGSETILGVSFVAGESQDQDGTLYKNRIQQLVEYIRQT